MFADQVVNCCKPTHQPVLPDTSSRFAMCLQNCCGCNCLSSSVVLYKSDFSTTLNNCFIAVKQTAFGTLVLSWLLPRSRRRHNSITIKCAVPLLDAWLKVNNIHFNIILAVDITCTYKHVFQQRLDALLDANTPDKRLNTISRHPNKITTS